MVCIRRSKPKRSTIEKETKTYATITIQNYFRMYNEKLAGMTGTAETEAGEFHDIYRLGVMVIQLRPCVRKDWNDLMFKGRRQNSIRFWKIWSKPIRKASL